MKTLSQGERVSEGETHHQAMQKVLGPQPPLTIANAPADGAAPAGGGGERGRGGRGGAPPQ
jgi:hypothetical protein